MEKYEPTEAISLLTKMFYKRNGTLPEAFSRVMRQVYGKRAFELIFRDDGVHVKYNIDGKFHDQYKIFDGEYNMDFSKETD